MVTGANGQPAGGQSGTGAQSGNNAQPGAGAAGTGAGEQGGENGQRVETFTAADMAKVRSEAAGYRTRATAAEAKVKEYEDAKLTEAEKATKRATEAAKLEERARTNLVRAEVRHLSVELGIIDPDVAFALLDLASIKVDDAGQVSGVKQALEDILKSKPYLKRPTDGTRNPGGEFNNGQNGDTNANKPNMNNLLRRAAGRQP